jgi:GT2 family glycosyltransferase
MTDNIFDSLTIVYSSNFDQFQNIEFETSLRLSSGLLPSQLEIICFENFNTFSLTEIYNKGLRIAKNETVLFLHNDVRLLNRDWALVLLRKFKESDFGILGLAGSIEMIRSKQEGAWFGGGELSTAGFVYHPDENGGIIEEWFSDRQDFIVPCVALDGVFIAVVKSRIVEEFDEEFKGFHYYDVSFCIRNFISGVKLGIICDGGIQLYHNSTGNRNEEWHQNRKLFLDKYRGDYAVPPLLNIPVITDKTDTSASAVHILILTKDRKELLFECLDAIEEHSMHPNLKIWVADTGSSKKILTETRQKINALNHATCYLTDFDCMAPAKKRKYNLLEFNNEERAGQINQILSNLHKQGLLAKDDFILFMDDNVKLMNDCITSTIELYQRERKKNNIGTVGIRLHCQENKVFHAGLDIAFGDPCITLTYKFQGHAYRYGGNSPYVDGTTAAFMLVSYGTFLDCGGFNNEYRNLNYDLAFCLQCIISGYTHLYSADSVALIRENKSGSIVPRQFEVPQQLTSILQSNKDRIMEKSARNC